MHCPHKWTPSPNYGWAPDSQQIAVALADYSTLDEEPYSIEGVLALLAADGSDSRLIALPEAIDPEVQVRWSPDGRFIAFVGVVPEPARHSDAASQFEYPAAIYIVDLTTDEIRHVVTADSPSVDGANAISFAWSPDSRNLAYSSMEGTGETSLFRIDIDGSNKQQLTPQGTHFDILYEIAWAPTPYELH